MKNELLNLSHFIHENPELGLKEYKACDAICTLLEKNGYSVTKGVAGLETSFIASVEGSSKGPHVVICAEYDALAEVDHGCGHNIIATCSTGAFLALAKEMKNFVGKLSIYGTPAEESYGGKQYFLRAGLFKDVDFAIMMHPNSGKSLVARGARTAGRMKVRFIGKPAHSSKPQDGINALDAAVDYYTKVTKLKESFIPGDNINMIMLEGGTASNVIPSNALMELNFRTAKYGRLKELLEETMKLAQESADKIGAKVECDIYKQCYERYFNIPLSTVFKENMESLGEEIFFADNSKFYGSSDMNDVSVHIPVIHDYISLSYKSIAGHTKEFAQVAISERADDVCLIGAKALAMTAIDIFQSKELRDKAWEYQKDTVPAEYGTFGK